MAPELAEPKVEESGSSLYIIIAIIIFFILVCVLFYLVKAGYLSCCKKPEPRQEQDAEAGRTLLEKENESDKSNPKKEDDMQNELVNESSATQGMLQNR